VSEVGGESFGNTLRRVRSSAGLSQEALAERAGLSARGISDLERGRRMPRLATVRMLADALELDASARSTLIRAAQSNLPPMPVPAGSVSADAAVSVADTRTGSHVNLPLPSSSLIGRERDVADVLLMLRSPATRLVTLTGPGGAGKTRLALRVVTDLVGEIDDGVFFIALAPLTDAELVVPTIAEVLGIRESSESNLLSTITLALRERSVLLLLDNFEHVLNAAPAIGELLARCAGVRVLVTSRAPLYLRGEQIVDVEPLALPMPGIEPSVEDVDQYGALTLFIDRARSVKPRFAASSANIAVINAVCQRLDGLPLAIELAAARMRVLTPEQLLALLDRRVLLLTGGARDLPVRHQTLRNTIAWSNDLLTADERRTFRWLSVFAGSWTLESAAAVTDDSEMVVLDRVGVLLDHSLVRRSDWTDPEARFEMLAVIREFGLEQLALDVEVDDVCQRHAAYFMTFVEQQGFDRIVTDEALRLARVDSVYDNVRTALRWFVDWHQSDMALRLCVALRQFWMVRGYLSEGSRWLDAALALDAVARTPDRARALHAAGSPVIKGTWIGSIGWRPHAWNSTRR